MQDSLTVLIINKEELNGLNIANNMFVNRSNNRILFLIEFTCAEYNYMNSALCQSYLEPNLPTPTLFGVKWSLIQQSNPPSPKNMFWITLIPLPPTPSFLIRFKPPSSGGRGD
ncbi:hypothetical protein CEXT_40051 [Caerostris extrusa]|uniref:Uncharacterized protein n=1 Tax=Caerostris extrusa TaxID=172846 RepID=A0AAV4MPP0_CAEEX|nr:hypothetical protein CEXT_40051 [Caerostris extrusa]